MTFEAAKQKCETYGQEHVLKYYDELSLAEFAYLVKETLNEETVRVVGDLDSKVRKVAVLGGSGGSYCVAAKKLGCDCIITGEVKQNNAIDALEYGMNIVEVSHSVEALFKEYR